MKQEAWYARYAWVWFALLALAGLLPAVALYLNPALTADLFARFGYDLPVAVSADAEATEYMKFVFHWLATGTIGFDLFGLAIALTAFRHAERWAWAVFWFWPALFLTHFFTYQSSFRYAQLAWLTISVAALLGTRRRVWTGATHEAAVATQVST